LRALNGVIHLVFELGKEKKEQKKKQRGGGERMFRTAEGGGGNSRRGKRKRVATRANILCFYLLTRQFTE